MPKVTSVRIESHVDEFTEEMKEDVYAWLESMGASAASAAADVAPYQTGRLRNSISWATKDKNDGKDADSNPMATPEDMSVYIGTNVPYAATQELGYGKIKAKHYLQYGASSEWNSKAKANLEEKLKGYGS